MTEPKPGDKVRVTYEGTYGPDRRVTASGIKSGHALTWPHSFGATVEVLTPADDPSMDLVGTVRRRLAYPLSRPVMRHDFSVLPWRTLAGTQYDDEEVVGWEIIGTVPGTPAANSPQEFKVGDLVAAKATMGMQEWIIGTVLPPAGHAEPDEIYIETSEPQQRFVCASTAVRLR